MSEATNLVSITLQNSFEYVFHAPAEDIWNAHINTELSPKGPLKKVTTLEKSTPWECAEIPYETDHFKVGAEYVCYFSYCWGLTKFSTRNKIIEIKKYEKIEILLPKQPFMECLKDEGSLMNGVFAYNFIPSASDTTKYELSSEMRIFSIPDVMLSYFENNYSKKAEKCFLKHCKRIEKYLKEEWKNTGIVTNRNKA